MSMEQFINNSKKSRAQREVAEAAQRVVDEQNEVIKDNREAQEEEKEREKYYRQTRRQYDALIPQINDVLRRSRIEQALQDVLDHANKYRDYRGREVNIQDSFRSIFKDKKDGQVVKKAELIIERPEDKTDDEKKSIIDSGLIPTWTAGLFWGVRKSHYYSGGGRGGVSSGGGVIEDVVSEGFSVEISPTGVSIDGTPVNDIENMPLIKQIVADAYTGVLEELD